MAEVKFYKCDFDAPEEVTYVVIGARYRDKWLFVKNRKRKAYEMPAGHIDKDEDALHAAGRELSEESGARKFIYRCVNTYSVNDNKSSTLWGKLFLSEISSLGDIVDTEEIEEVYLSDDIPGNTSFPGVLNVLFEKLKTFI